MYTVYKYLTGSRSNCKKILNDRQSVIVKYIFILFAVEPAVVVTVV